MTQTGRVLYTARAHTTGGRESGASRTDDGRLDVNISPPGATGPGTNPELQARLNVHLPGVEPEIGRALVEVHP